MTKKGGWWSYPSSSGSWQYNKPPRKGGCGSKAAKVLILFVLSAIVIIRKVVS